MDLLGDATRADTLGVASMAFGFLSLGLCLWYPFGAVLGGCGAGFALACRLAGGSRAGWLGALYSAGGLTAGILLGWNHWYRAIVG